MMTANLRKELVMNDVQNFEMRYAWNANPDKIFVSGSFHSLDELMLVWEQILKNQSEYLRFCRIYSKDGAIITRLK